MDLNGKVAIVTGSSRGLGKSIAKTFARAGAKVTLAARTEEPNPRVGGTIHETAEQIKAEGGISLPIRCNLANDEEVDEMVRRTLEEFGRIDVLVNPAAANFPGGFEDNTMRRWDVLMGLNFRAVAFMAKAVLPAMREAGEGHIINVSPKLSGDPGGPFQLSKQVSTLLSLSLAAEFKKDAIAVNTIWPSGRLHTEGMVALGWIDKDTKDPQQFADAVAAMVAKDPRTYTGRSMSDTEVLQEEGVTDFSKYDLPSAE